MSLYEEIKKAIEVYNSIDQNKASLTDQIREFDGKKFIAFHLQVDNVSLYFYSYQIVGVFTEETAKKVAAANILNYLIKSRIPIWKESLASKP